MENEIIGLNKKQKIVKRCFDLLVATIMIIIFLPIFIIIAIAIKIDSKGRIIYKQERIGKDGKIFKIYKFRTMYENAESKTGPILEKENDERVTRVGKTLRRTKLDEIPQFFNVLIGNMSIVGPRPERPFLADKIKSELKEFELREKVKPGITGLACITLGYYAKPKDKLKYDLKYIKEWSLLKDIKICINTIKFIFVNNIKNVIKL